MKRKVRCNYEFQEKVNGNTDNEITGVAYMTDEEIAELFGDMSDPDNES